MTENSFTASIDPFEQNPVAIESAPEVDIIPWYKRDKDGLLETVKYIRNPDKSINWRAMVKSEYLYPNKEKFKNKEIPDSIEGLSDAELLISLAGIKEVADLRGFKSVKFEVKHISEDYVSAKCQIIWRGNFETSGEEVLYEAYANCNRENCSGIFASFREALATNRAFIRAVRNFLKIHIVGAEEMAKGVQSSSDAFDGESAPVQSSLEHDTLRKRLKAAGIPNIKALHKEFPELAGIEKIEDIKGKSLWDLLGKLDSYKKKN